MQLRVLATVGVAAIGMVVGANGARADCSGPTIEYDGGTLDRGDTITVRGTFWGDRCYDTGPPPKGEQTLGLPVHGIEIVFVQTTEIVVARGAADQALEFEVDVVVPTQLASGPVELVARWDGGPAFDQSTQAPAISDQPVADREASVASFGPVTPVTRDPAVVPTATQPHARPGRSTWILPTTIAVVATGLVRVEVRRRVLARASQRTARTFTIRDAVDAVRADRDGR